MNYPIDELHAECLTARREIRRAFMEARWRVAEAPLGNYPRQKKEKS